MQNRRSPGYRWARDHLLPGPGASAAWGFQERLEASQWYTGRQHLAYQMKRLEELLRHAAAHVPRYADILDDIGLPPGQALDMDLWRRVPVVTRRDIQDRRADFIARQVPREHGRTVGVQSSGSTGAPIETLGTELVGSWNRALQLRVQLWAIDRCDCRMAVIRRYNPGIADYPHGLKQPNWAEELTLPVATGPAFCLNASTPAPKQIEWLLKVEPEVLFTYPSVLKALLDTAENTGTKLPRLKRIETISEPVDNELRTAARRLLGAGIFDVYSANEIGPIALQCPDAEVYHVQSEALLLEVLDDAGRPCAPGETGRVILTPLHGYAMPLLRYEIGDMATVGAPCRCGRHLPVITRIVGRQRNMMIGPKGERFRPSLGWKHIRSMAPVDQGQFVQTDIRRLEGRLVVKRPLTAREEDAIRAHLKSRMPQLNEIAFVYVDDVPRSESGKFEDFISLVRPEAADGGA